jgi:ABC-type multidrug transport system fused ATPase/permease subunit
MHAMTDAKKRLPRIPDRPWPFIAYLLSHCPRRMKMQALLAFLCEGCATVCDVFVTWVLGRIIGVIVASEGADVWPPVLVELGILAGIWTLRNAFYRTREFLDRRYVPVLLDMARDLLFNRLIQQSQAFLHSNFAGVLANHVRRAGDVVGGLREKIEHNIIPLVVRFVTAGALLWGITPMLTVFIFAFIILGIVAASLTAPKWTRISAVNAESASRLTGYIVDSTTNLSVVQQNVGWREELRRLTRAHDDLSRSYRERLAYVSWFWGSFDTVMTFFFCGFMALVVYGWRTGDVTTAELAMAVGLVNNMFGALAGTVNLLSSKFDDIGILQESLQKISTPLTVIDRPGALDLHVSASEIEFRDVVFAYGGGAPLFDRLSFTIPAGQKVGLVGVSGAGKTSVCQLLLRAYDVQGGGIYIDGQNIAAVTQDSLHAAIAVIPQEPVLFHRTLGENIGYARPSAALGDIRRAAAAAEAAGFIETLPQGYDTLVGERGVKLSGGQRQRVAIARAIIKDAHLLVLDEATSALDSETEKSIQKAMMEAMKGRTTVVVAHRLSTLSNMDRIIVMDSGRIVEDGSFQELLRAGGTFARLWNLQAGGFLPEEI